MNQRRQPNGNLDWPKWVQFTARLYLLANADIFHLCDPRFIRWSPGGIEDNCLRFPQASRQRKLRVADADLVRLQERAFLEYIHAESGNVNDNARVFGHGIRPRQDCIFRGFSCIALSVLIGLAGFESFVTFYPVVASERE